jgi:hypothetical protein
MLDALAFAPADAEDDLICKEDVGVVWVLLVFLSLVNQSEVVDWTGLRLLVR